MEDSAKAGGGEGRSPLLVWGLATRVGAICAFAATAIIGVAVFDWAASLTISLVAMTAFVVAETTVLYLWARPYAQGGGEGSSAGADNPYAEAAKIAITTQGVVLGLVALQEGRLPDVTLKVGACALVLGVLCAGVLYLSVAFGPPPDMNRAIVAAVLFSLVYWCLGFGLICVVAGSWS
jgi:hypothetical protein